MVGSGRSGILQTNWDHRIGTDTNVRAMRAPEGSLDALMALVPELGAAEVPGYSEFVMAIKQKAFQQAQGIAQKSFQGLMDKAHMDAQQLSDEHNRYMTATQEQYARQRTQFAHAIDVKDRNNQNFVDYAANQTYYLNPETGGRGTLPDIPGAARYAVPSTTPGWWVQLQPILH